MVWSIPHQSREAHNLLLPVILLLQIGNLIVLVTQGKQEMMKGERREIGKLDDGHCLGRDYLVFLKLYY